jgi:hypothetical protein
MRDYDRRKENIEIQKENYKEIVTSKNRKFGKNWNEKES